MKKILLLILSVVCLMLGSCTDVKTDAEGNKIFDLEPGVELISANYDAWGGYYNCITRKADSTYVPQEKKLIGYGSITGYETFSVTFREH